MSAHGENRTELFYDAADVTFAGWPEDVLRAYTATGECDDKAGFLRHTGPRLLPCLGSQRPMGDNRGPPRTCRGAKVYGWGKYRSSSLFGNKSFIEIEDTRTQF